MTSVLASEKEKLQKTLQDLAKSLAGFEALFEICSEAASYITNHNNVLQTNVASLGDQLESRTLVEDKVSQTSKVFGLS